MLWIDPPLLRLPDRPLDPASLHLQEEEEEDEKEQEKVFSDEGRDKPVVRICSRYKTPWIRESVS